MISLARVSILSDGTVTRICSLAIDGALSLFSAACFKFSLKPSMFGDGLCEERCTSAETPRAHARASTIAKTKAHDFFISKGLLAAKMKWQAQPTSCIYK